VSTDLLRRRNRRLDDMDDTTKGRLVSRLLGRWILPSNKGERPPPMTAEVLAFTRELNADIAASVRSHRADVVGDLAELDGSPGDLAASLDKPSGEEPLDAAAWAIDGLRRWLGEDASSTADRTLPAAVSEVESLLRAVVARDRLDTIGCGPRSGRSASR
jgi:hypothetical protein